MGNFLEKLTSQQYSGFAQMKDQILKIYISETITHITISDTRNERKIYKVFFFYKKACARLSRVRMFILYKLLHTTFLGIIIGDVIA